MKVVNFNDACYKPDPDAIDICEKLLEKAKSGEIQSLLVMCGNRKHSWTDAVLSENGPSHFTQLGGVYSLLCDINKSFEEED
jgi:hypothetical protein